MSMNIFNISFPTIDSSNLSARIAMQYGQSPSKLILFCHGHTETMNAFDKYHEEFVNNDVMTAAISYRDDDKFPVLKGAEDVIYAASYLLNTYKSLNTTYVYSASMGGAIAGTAIAESINYSEKLNGIKFSYWVNASGVTNLKCLHSYISAGKIIPSLKQILQEIEDDAGGSPSDNPDGYIQRSPALRGSDLKKAGLEQVQIIHSLFDVTVPYTHAMELNNTLKENNISVNLNTLLNVKHVNTVDTNNPVSSAGIKALHALISPEPVSLGGDITDVNMLEMSLAW